MNFLPTARRWARRLGGLAVLVALIAAVGCGPRIGTIKGNVSYKGKSLRGGTVTFAAEKVSPQIASIDEDGNYFVQRIPVGEYKVTVFTGGAAKPSGPPGGADPSKQMFDPSKFASTTGKGEKGDKTEKADKAPKLDNIPDKYGSPATSGLTYTVRPGDQVHDIELK